MKKSSLQHLDIRSYGNETKLGPLILQKKNISIQNYQSV